MRYSILSLVLSGCMAVVGCETLGVGGKNAAPAASASSEAGLVAEYETLSDQILKDRKRELEIVAALLRIYAADADKALVAVATTEGAARNDALKAAIESLTEVAQEGDRAVDAIKLKLRKGGHHHNQEEGSADEYIYIDSKAKATLMAEAEKLRRALAGSQQLTAAEVDAIRKQVADVVAKALAG